MSFEEEEEEEEMGKNTLLHFILKNAFVYISAISVCLIDHTDRFEKVTDR